MECAVCFEPYDLELHRPKVMPCGHSLCMRCLVDPGLGKLCPQDRKEFQEEPAQLPDNLTLISIIAHAGAPQRPAHWCRDCKKDFTDDCADAGHQACSRKQLRAEQVASLAQCLRRGVAASTALEQHFEAGMQDAQQQMQTHRTDRCQFQETLSQLEATAKAKNGLKQAMDAAEQLGPQAKRLEESASLAGLRGRCSVAVQAEDGAEWRASVALEDGKRCALRLALLQLRSDGDLTKVSDEVLPAVPNVAQSTLDLAEKDPAAMTATQRAEFLQDAGLKRVRSLKGVDCSVGPRFFELLLQAVGPHLEELELNAPRKEHMELLKCMPFLRKLSLADTKDNPIPDVSELPVNLEELSIYTASAEHLRLIKDLVSLRKLDVHVEEYISDAPALPLQLEDLTIEYCSGPQWISIHRMPKLRRLFVDGFDCYPVVDASLLPAKLPPGHCGLVWLKIAVSVSSALSLIRLHCDTLQEILLLCSSKDDGDIFHDNLADYLRGLKSLQRLVLIREMQGWNPLHDVHSCRLQICELQDALLHRDVAGTVKTVSVVCQLCDDVQV